MQAIWVSSRLVWSDMNEWLKRLILYGNLRIDRKATAILRHVGKLVPFLPTLFPIGEFLLPSEANLAVIDGRSNRR